MAKKVKKGDTIPVKVKFEYEGTVHNKKITVEGQMVGTSSNPDKHYDVSLNGDPVIVYAKFSGVKGSTLKKFEVNLNGITVYSYTDIKFNVEEVLIAYPVSYKSLDLEEIKSDEPNHA